MSRENTSNFNQALWLGIGQLCTFVLSFLSAAIFARYFDKQEYGTYKQILYIYTTMQSLFTMGLPSAFAYFIPRMNANEQKSLVNGLTRIFLLLGVVFSLSLFFLAKPISIWLNNPELAVGIKIFSPFPLFTIPAMGVEGIYTALKKTKSIAVYNIASKAMMLACIVIPVIVFHTTYRGAILGWGAASFITFLIAMYMKNKPYTKIKQELVSNMYNAIFDYSLPIMGACAFGFCIHAADQFFVSRYYGTEAFAEYSNGCLSIPIVAMIASSVKSVLLPLFSKADAERSMEKAVTTYNNALYESVKIVFPILVFSMFFAVELMVLIYGEKYAVSGTYLRFYMLKDFIDVFPYLAVLLAIGESKFYMQTHFIAAVYVWALDYMFVRFGAPAYVIMLVASTSQYLIRFTSFVHIKRKSGFSLINKQILVFISKILLHCSVCLVPIFLLLHKVVYLSSPFVIIAIAAILFYAILLPTGLMLKIDYTTSIKKLLK